MADTQVTQKGKTTDTVCHAGKKQKLHTGRYHTVDDRWVLLCESAVTVGRPGGSGFPKSYPLSSFPVFWTT